MGISEVSIMASDCCTALRSLEMTADIFINDTKLSRFREEETVINMLNTLYALAKDGYAKAIAVRDSLEDMPNE